ncbi:PfkB family carbohydrate kinase [Massilia sp. PWRC2]|uniref:PfkB family carbohydrate kinase n=1 Tax=Massilia sp. PWRC2 TaxID=2804626 RepID=UPI003CEB168A
MIATFGEALVDLIEQDDGRFAAVLGGSVCNVTVALARQQLPVTYLNPLSADSFGARFAGQLQAAGVQLATPQRSTLPTALALVTLDANKLPSYAFHRAGVADRDISADAACAALPSALTLLHTGGLALVPADLASALAVAAAAQRSGALLSVDANMRPLAVADLPTYAAGVRRMLAKAQLVKVSAEDLRYLGLDGDPVAAARHLFDGSASALIALTLGEHGAVLLTRTASVALPAPPAVTVVDTVGAGDCFLAGLVASLQHTGALSTAALAAPDQATLTQALRYAIASATINVMREGCAPPTRGEVGQFLARG